MIRYTEANQIWDANCLERHESNLSAQISISSEPKHIYPLITGRLMRVAHWLKHLISHPYSGLLIASFGILMLLKLANVQNVLRLMNDIDSWHLLPALGLMILAEAVDSVRWWRLLRLYGVQLSLYQVLTKNLIARFYGQFMPGGGAVGLAVRVSASTEKEGQLHAPIAAITVDRVVNLVSLFVLGALFAAITRPKMIDSSFLTILFAITGFLALFVISLRSSVFVRWLGYIPQATGFGGLRTTLEVMNKGLCDNLALAQASGLSALGNFCSLMALYVVIRVIAGNVSFTDFVSLGAFVDTIQSLPLTPGGLGLREGTYAAFFASLGVTTAQAVTVGLVILLLNSLRALPGGLLLFYGAVSSTHINAN